MNPYEDENLSKLLSNRKKVVQPLPGQTGRDEPNPAVDLIRQKLDALYAKEPDVKKEVAEVITIDRHHRSPHQQFMYKLSQSGKSLAEIQTAWHNYYISLSDQEKHRVWQEFYAEHGRQSQPKVITPQLPHIEPPEPVQPKPPVPQSKPDSRTISDLKQQLLGKVQSRAKAKPNTHLRSLAFGLGTGALAVLILLFGFFNERIIVPFVTPSRTVSSTPIIVDPGSTTAGPEPKIIIPKINVEIPVVYDEPSIAEDNVQRALERGVVHYATTPEPGQTGNGVIFGHSSNNILNKGKYKFAFVLLHRLENGDTFMLQKDGKRYVYRVYDKKIVRPTEIGVLGNAGRPASFTLITCDPPGTTLNRLVVVGEQISPDPATNVAGTTPDQVQTPASGFLPSDSPSLWERMMGWFSG